MWSNDFWEEFQPFSLEKLVFSTCGSGKTDYPYAKNEVKLLLNTV